MLGQEVARQANVAGIETLKISRSADISWDYYQSSFVTLIEELGLQESDVLVNCIGWIPQKSSGDPELDRVQAYKLNVALISEIQSEQVLHGFGWIQILTDCVFDGKAGGYLEGATHSPVDLYGSTKSLGEDEMPGAMKIRSSIVGPDINHGSGLFEWLRGQDLGAELKGYQNQFWNGVSTLAFSRLVANLALQKLVIPGTHHWIPLDSVTKFELLEIFRTKLHRGDLTLSGVTVGDSIDRTLRTSDLEKNSFLWSLAGYKEVPTVEQICDEFIDLDKRERDQK
jgi:dTDP-4-dehydrorhamnose reductase